MLRRKTVTRRKRKSSRFRAWTINHDAEKIAEDSATEPCGEGWQTAGSDA
jgi:hypothetical protein